MKTIISALTLALLFTILCAGPAFADTPEKMIIKLKTNEFEIAETDISDLQVGDAETIVTDTRPRSNKRVRRRVFRHLIP